jgi:hypothetical protein
MIGSPHLRATIAVTQQRRSASNGSADALERRPMIGAMEVAARRRLRLKLQCIDVVAKSDGYRHFPGGSMHG